jgi:polyphosphate glucokinase
MAKKAIGIDIGGTGIKGAIVDVKNGVLIGDRVRYETPEGGHPQDIAVVVAKIVRDLKPSSQPLFNTDALCRQQTYPRNG